MTGKDDFNHGITQPVIDKIKETWAGVISDMDKAKYPRYHSERRGVDEAFTELITFVDPFYVRELELHCGLCGKRPAELGSVVDLAKIERLTPDEYVYREEGTLNRDTGQFACDDCYIKLGCPANPYPNTGWKYGDSLN